MDVASQHREMSCRTPGGDDRGRTPNIAPPADARAQWHTSNVVNPVAQALSPEKVPIERQCELLSGVKVERRVQVNHVQRSHGVQEVEVNARWEQWVECLQVR